VDVLELGVLDVLAGIVVAVFSLIATGGASRVVRAAARTVGPAIANLL